MNKNRDKSIVHISFDFPDSINNNKTKAISNLINAQKEFKNIVFSLNRTANPFADFNYKKEHYGYSLNIYGLPYGIGLRIWMYFAFKKIHKLISREKINVDLIHGHKLSFEGLISRNLSQELSVPYIISVRGYTDFTAIKFSPFNRKLFLKILQKSSKVIYLTPWSKDKVQQIFSEKVSGKKSLILPNIIILNDITINTQERFPDKFVTVFNLDSYKAKNIKRTILAMNIVHKKYPQLKLDIIGGGKSAKKIQSYIYKNQTIIPKTNKIPTAKF